MRSRGRRTWTKAVTAVDSGGVLGYSFLGEKLWEGQHDLQEGTILVRNSPGGTTRKPRTKWTWTQVEPGRLRWSDPVDSRKFLDFRDEVTQVLELARAREMEERGLPKERIEEVRESLDGSLGEIERIRRLWPEREERETRDALGTVQKTVRAASRDLSLLLQAKPERAEETDPQGDRPEGDRPGGEEPKGRKTGGSRPKGRETEGERQKAGGEAGGAARRAGAGVTADPGARASEDTPGTGADSPLWKGNRRRHRQAPQGRGSADLERTRPAGPGFTSHPTAEHADALRLRLAGPVGGDQGTDHRKTRPPKGGKTCRTFSRSRSSGWRPRRGPRGPRSRR